MWEVFLTDSHCKNQFSTAVNQIQRVSCEAEFSRVFSFLLQCVIQMQPRRAGAAVPLHLAAHIRPSVTSKYAGHQLLSNPVPHRCAGSMFAGTAGAAHRGGTCVRNREKRFIFTFASRFLVNT